MLYPYLNISDHSRDHSPLGSRARTEILEGAKISHEITHTLTQVNHGYVAQRR